MEQIKVDRLKFIVGLVLAYAALVYFGAWAGVYLFCHGHFFTVFQKPDNIFSAMWKWDSNFYVSIAQHGYLWNGNFHQQQNIAFFPLYPIAIRFSHILFGGWSGFVVIIPATIIGISSIIAFFVLALLQLPEKQARIATVAYTLFPGSMWFFSAYPVSLINLFIILSMIGLTKKWKIIPYIFAGIGTSAGPTVVFYSFSIFIYEFISKINTTYFFELSLIKKIKEIFLLSLNGIISLSGIAIFMVYQYLIFGNPLAFNDAQRAFINKTFIQNLHGFFNIHILNPAFFKELFKSLLFAPSNSPAVQVQLYFLINLIALFVVAFSVYVSVRKKLFNYALYGTISIFSYLWFFGSTIGPFNGARILYAVVPTFIMLGYIHRDDRFFVPFLILIFSLCLVMQTALDTAGYTIY